MRELARGAAASDWHDLFGDRLYVELQRHGIGHASAASRRADRSRLSPRACRWSRPTSRISPSADDYEAHDALLCIAGGTAGRRDRARAAHARSSLQDPRRDGGAVRRPARGARHHRRDRRALRVSGRARASRSCRASPSAPGQRGGRGKRRGRRVAPPGRGGPCATASRRHGVAPGITEEDYQRAAGVRARRHHAHEVSRATS